MLLLDIGNSAIKAQWWKAQALQLAFTSRFEAGWQTFFSDCLSKVEANQCYFTAVSGNQYLADIEQNLSTKFTSQDPVRLKSLESYGLIRNAYSQPEKLGVDRWLALLGSHHLVTQDAMIVDAGSAITIDLLQKNGTHLGGAILPGFNTSIERFKQMLNKVDYQQIENQQLDSPGCSTQDCIQINYELTTSASVENLINHWFKLLEKDAVLIVTGGDVDRITKHPLHSRLVVPDLVMQGIKQQIKGWQ